MAIKFKITNEEYTELPDVLKAEYSAKDGGYVADIVGIDLTANTKLDKERDRRRAAEKQRDDAVKELDDFKDGDDRAAMATKHAKELDKVTKERDALTGDFTGYVRSKELDSAANALAAKLSPKHANLMLPHVLSRLDLDITDLKAPKVVIKDAKGAPDAKLTPDDLYKEMLANKDFAAIVEVSQASGGSASRPGGTPPRGVPGAGGTPPNTGAAPARLSDMRPGDLKAHMASRIAARQSQ